MSTTEDLVRVLNQQHAELKGLHQGTDERIGGLVGRVTEIEQHLAQRRGGGGDYSRETLGAAVVKHEAFDRFVKNGCAGQARFRIDLKTITTAPTSAGPIIVPDQQPGAVLLPRRQLSIRQVIASGQTSSN